MLSQDADERRTMNYARETSHCTLSRGWISIPQSWLPLLNLVVNYVHSPYSGTLNLYSALSFRHCHPDDSHFWICSMTSCLLSYESKPYNHTNWPMSRGRLNSAGAWLELVSVPLPHRDCFNSSPAFSRLQIYSGPSHPQQTSSPPT